jgi:plasmid stabilization system protein ParE
VGQTRSVKLRYTLPALADLSVILDYIAAHSPQGAQRVQARIQALTDLLLLHPQIGRRTNDPAIRRMATTPYPIWFSTRSPRTRSSFTPSGTRPVTRPACPVPPDPVLRHRTEGGDPYILCPRG